MKNLLIVLLIVLGLVAIATVAGTTQAEAGTVVIVKTDGGGVGPTPPSDGGGTTYCDGNLAQYAPVVYSIFGWLRCQVDYHFDPWSSFFSAYNGWMLGCGWSQLPCAHWHRI